MIYTAKHNTIYCRYEQTISLFIYTKEKGYEKYLQMYVAKYIMFNDICIKCVDSETEK